MPSTAPLRCDAATHGVSDFYNAALSLAPHVSDKVHYTGIGHHYELIYGIFMIPLLASAPDGAGLKILEIGLGCDYQSEVHKTQAKSARLWRKLAPKATLYEAEYDRRCVEAHAALWRELQVSTLVGDQGSNATLAKWIAQSGGSYDVVIDDGSHRNSHILTSFHALWPHVVPGGLYFLEDLLVGRHTKWDDTRGTAVISDVLQAWTDQLIIPSNYARRAGCSGPRDKRCAESSAPEHSHAAMMRTRFPLPDGVAFIFCQRSACVIGKKAWPGNGLGDEPRARRSGRTPRNEANG